MSGMLSLVGKCHTGPKNSFPLRGSRDLLHLPNHHHNHQLVGDNIDKLLTDGQSTLHKGKMSN